MRFVVRAVDGTVLDEYDETELATFERTPEKTWQEAALWAVVAVAVDRRVRGAKEETCPSRS